MAESRESRSHLMAAIEMQPSMNCGPGLSAYIHNEWKVEGARKSNTAAWLSMLLMEN